MNKPIRNYVPDTLDPRAVAAVIFMAIVEFEIFNPVRQVIMAAQRDAWLSIIIGGSIVSGLTWLILKLAIRFPTENFFQYSRRVWGGLIFYLIAMVFLVYWLSYSAFHLKNTLLANQIFFLRGVPLIIPAIFLMLGAISLVLYGLTSVVRFFQLMLPFVIITALPIIPIAFATTKATNFFPVLENGIIPVIKGAFLYLGFFPGLEIILFLMPFLSKPKKAVVPALIGVNALNVMALIQVIMAVGMLGTRSAQELIWPNIAALELLILPGFPVERFDLLMTFPWLIGLFTAICTFLYLQSYGIIQVFNLEKNKKWVIVVISISMIILASMIPNYAWILKAQGYIRFVTLGLVFVIPILTLLLALLRNVRGDSA